MMNLSLLTATAALGLLVTTTTVLIVATGWLLIYEEIIDPLIKQSYSY